MEHRGALPVVLHAARPPDKHWCALAFCLRVYDELQQGVDSRARLAAEYLLLLQFVLGVIFQRKLKISILVSHYSSADSSNLTMIRLSSDESAEHNFVLISCN